jgi:hypothetical protein
VSAAGYVTEISDPRVGDNGIQRLHSRMLEPEPLPDPEPEPEAGSWSGLYGSGMHDFVLLEAEIGTRAALYADLEACGFSALDPEPEPEAEAGL